MAKLPNNIAMIPPLTPIGRIAGKHGFRGELNIILERDDAQTRIKKGNYLFIELDGKGVPFLIEQVSQGGQIIKLADIDSETAATAYLGLPVSIPAGSIKKAKPGPFQGIIGFMLHDSTSHYRGIIKEVQEFPQGMMMITEQEGKTLLIPAVEDWIKGIDEQKKTIMVQLPEGLTEI